MCDVIVLSSTSSFAAFIRDSRSFTWPGCFASACTSQNSVRVRSALRPFQEAQTRATSRVSAPRTSVSSAFVGFARRLDPAEQSADAREEVGQAHVLGDVVVGAHAQAGDHVEVGVARGQEDDRKGGGESAQFAAQGEAAVHVGAEADVEQGQIGKVGAERLERALPIRE